AGALNITADASLLSDAVTHAVTVGFASITGAQATSNVSAKTDAYLGKSADTIGGGTIHVDLTGPTTLAANSTATSNATAQGVGGGVLADINLLFPTATTNGATRVYIGPDTQLGADSVTGTADSHSFANA